MNLALLQVRRWLPTRKLVFVADSSYACLALLHRMRRLPQAITMVGAFPIGRSPCVVPQRDARCALALGRDP